MKKRIVFVTDHLKMGGAEKVLIEILKNINTKKYDVRLIVKNNYGTSSDVQKNNFEKDIPENIPYTFIQSEKWTNYLNTTQKKRKLLYNLLIKHIRTIFTWIQLIRICQKISPIDLFIDFNTHYAKHLNWISAKKKIAWTHTSILHTRGNLNKIARFGKRLIAYDYIISISDEMQAETERLFPFLKKKLINLYNPFDFERIRTASLDQSQLNITEKLALKEKYYVAVSRLDTKQKDYLTLLKAVEILKKSDIQEKLYIIGEGPNRLEIEQWIQKMGLTDQVKLLGLQNNPYVWMKNAAFLVHSSNYEGLPTVLIEAMILGKYVISSDCPTGPKEILKNGEIGTLVKMGDALAFANAIENQIKNPANMQMLEKIAKSIKRFELSEVMKKQQELFDFSSI